jgi:hypothetical protein
MKCGPVKAGRKKCRVGTREFTLHDEATAGTKSKRRAAAGRLRKYRFTKADAKACRQKDPSTPGKCMAKRVDARR